MHIWILCLGSATVQAVLYVTGFFDPSVKPCIASMYSLITIKICTFYILPRFEEEEEEEICYPHRDYRPHHSQTNLLLCASYKLRQEKCRCVCLEHVLLSTTGRIWDFMEVKKWRFWPDGRCSNKELDNKWPRPRLQLIVQVWFWM